MTAAFNIAGTVQNGQTITASSVADDLDITVVATGETATINGDGGNDDVDVAAGAVGLLTINGGAGNDDINVALASNPGTAGTDIITVDGGAGIDVITLATVAGDERRVASTAEVAADADIIEAFNTTHDLFDYNGTLANGTTTSGIGTVVTVADGSGTLSADITTGLTGNANTTVFVFANQVSGDAATSLNLLGDATVATLTALWTTFEADLIAEFGVITSLDASLGSSDSVLFVFDDNDDSVIVRVTNTDTSTANTITAAEIELIAISDAGGDVFVAADFM